MVYPIDVYVYDRVCGGVFDIARIRQYAVVVCGNLLYVVRFGGNLLVVRGVHSDMHFAKDVQGR